MCQTEGHQWKFYSNAYLLCHIYSVRPIPYSRIPNNDDHRGTLMEVNIKYERVYREDQSRKKVSHLHTENLDKDNNTLACLKL
jgi:Fe-S-cluster containining protein